MVASGVWAGEIAVEKAHRLIEVGDGGRSMKQELDRIGYLGEIAASHKAMPLGVNTPLPSVRRATLTTRGSFRTAYR